MFTVTYRDRHAVSTESATILDDALALARRLSSVPGVLAISIATPQGALFTAW